MVSHPDDRRLAIASRTLRRKSSLTQRAVVLPGELRRLVLALERGDAGRLRVDQLRAHFAQFGASVRVTVYWNGAALDRTIDERHASIGEAAIGILRHDSWATLSEVTFADFGERGSIDVLATRERESAALVGEVKSEWSSIEETNRSLDVKARLAPKICFDRFGWRPAIVAKVLILPDDGSARRIAARYRETLDFVYPARTRDVRRWLKRPSGALAGIWFFERHGRVTPDLPRTPQVTVLRQTIPSKGPAVAQA